MLHHKIVLYIRIDNNNNNNKNSVQLAANKL